MRPIHRFGALFIGPALLAFALLVPEPASSAGRSVAGSGCQIAAEPSGSVDYTCPIVGQSNMQSNSVTAATYDFVCIANQQATYGLFKRTTSGSLYSDQGSFVCTSGSAQTKYVYSANVRQNASSTDYLWNSILNVQNVYGVETAFYSP